MTIYDMIDMIVARSAIHYLHPCDQYCWVLEVCSKGVSVDKAASRSIRVVRLRQPL